MFFEVGFVMGAEVVFPVARCAFAVVAFLIDFSSVAPLGLVREAVAFYDACDAFARDGGACGGGAFGEDAEEGADVAEEVLGLFDEIFKAKFHDIGLGVVPGAERGEEVEVYAVGGEVF